MILFSFDNGVRKQDVLANLLPQIKDISVSRVSNYEYNVKLERIEFFGLKCYYYDHWDKDTGWIEFQPNFDNVDGANYMDCISILIK
jgi:hypothetical protein